LIIISTKRKVPLWKYSCIDGLQLEIISSDLDDMIEFEWEYENHSRKEDFQIFFCDISARAEQLSDLIYQCREYFYEQDDFRGWNDFCVVLLGGTHKILGYDAVEMDYFSMFERGWGFGNELAVEEAQKRLERFTKKELIDRWQKVLTILTSYLELKAAYDALTGALDFLENDSLKKSEELTRDIDYYYRRLRFYDGSKEPVRNDDLRRFEQALEKTYPAMWVY
jgi:hypothetical protein